MLNRPMAKPILQRPRIMPRIGQGIAARMPKHVTVNREGKACTLADPLDQPINGVGRERTAALGRKDEAALGELPAQLAQCPDFITAQRVNAGLAVLDAPDVQRRRPAELDLRPL